MSQVSYMIKAESQEQRSNVSKLYIFGEQLKKLITKQLNWWQHK